MGVVEPKEIEVRYTIERLDCPFCGQSVDIVVTIKINDADVRHVATHGMDAVFNVRVDPIITKVTINHECSGPVSQEQN